MSMGCKGKKKQTNIEMWRDFHIIINPLNAGGMWMISTKRHSWIIKKIKFKNSKADEGAQKAHWQLALECFHTNNNNKNRFE